MGNAARTDFVDATLRVDVHAAHHNQLGAAGNGTTPWYHPGRWYDGRAAPANTATVAYNTGAAYYSGCCIHAPITVNQLGCWTVAGSVAAGLLRMGLIAPHPTTGYPTTTIVAQTGQVTNNGTSNTATTATVTPSPVAVPAGFYYLAIVCNTSGMGQLLEVGNLPRVQGGTATGEYMTVGFTTPTTVADFPTGTPAWTPVLSPAGMPGVSFRVA